MLKMKKISIILITVLSIVLIVFLGWYFLLRDKSVPAGEALRDILPFGSGEDINIPALLPDGEVTDSLQSIVDEFGNPAANLFRISAEPVAGVVLLNTHSTSSGQGGTSTVIVRYVDRATGHIYDTDLATLVTIKVTNQTLPKIYEAYFRSDGNAVLFRSLKNDSDVVENLSLSLTPPKEASTTLYSVSSTPLRGDISAVAVGSSNTLLYALKDTSSIVSSTFNGTGIKTLLNSPFNSWRLVTAGNNLVIHTKASSNTSGYAYTLNISNGAFKKILGPLNGLAAIPSATGNRILYSYVENSITRLFAKNLGDNSLSEILPVTLAEKCVWSTKNIGTLFCGSPTNGLGFGEPDNWYRGASHFSDRIWLFDTNIDIAQVLVEPKPSLGIDIDAIELKLSLNEDYLVFINKTDLSLWALRLE